MLGGFLRDVIRRNPHTFRLFGPDETASNRLSTVYEATDKVFEAEILGTDEHLARAGQVTEVLSEHLCEGWLEGYLLTGRHGLFNCYEAFVHIVDSMFNQHAKWLKVTRDIPWRRPIASLNYLLSSHVWRQDHNGFTHQDPGFIDHVMNKKAEVIRVYLPPDANCLLSVADHCLRSRHYVNVIVAGKQDQPNWLSMEEAVLHCARGIGIWDWASTDDSGTPDVVLGCAGDVPTLETLAAARILRDELSDLKVRVVNVVDLMRLQDPREHPHGLPNAEFDSLFTTDRPVVFAYHGYPWLIHRLTYRRTNHDNMHVRGYKEEGTTTTPFDMVMLNDLDRFHLVIDVIDRVPGPRRSRRPPPPGDGRPADRGPRLHPRARRGRSRDPRLDLDRPSPMRVLVLNAGSSSLKTSLVEQPGDGRCRAAPLQRAAAARCLDRGAAAVLGEAGDGRRGRSPGGPRRPALHRPLLDRRRGGRPSRRAARPRAAAQRPRPGGHRGGASALPAVAAGRLLRHRLPRRAAAGGARLPAALRVVRRLGRPPLRLPRPVGGVVGRARRVTPRPSRRRSWPLVVAHLGSGCSVTAVSAAARSTPRWA